MKMFVAFLKKILGIQSPAILHFSKYSYEYDYLKAKKDKNKRKRLED